MATKAEIEAQLERQRLELRALRDKAAALPDGPERDAINAQRDALRAQQKTTTRELEVATSQSPATGEFEGVDQNSGQYRYKNPETGTSFLSNTAPTTAQQQSSGITVPPEPAPAPATEARPETAPAEVQTPAVAPPLVDTVSPADVPAAQSPYASQRTLQNEQVQAAQPEPVAVPREVAVAQANDITEAPAPVDPQTFETGGGGGNQGTITRVSYEPAPVDAETASIPTGDQTNTTITQGEDQSAAETNRLLANQASATKQRAQEQAVLQARLGQTANGDWRVRIRLAPNSNYLYNAGDPSSILAPLKASDGVIFPYTPTISTAYKAEYDNTDLVHSNYRGQFYKSSNVNEISINGIFTAQDTVEANYVLAVIHFFRSVTKMFYGQDAERGTPPPLVYLSGYGPYQFNGHPCVVQSFNYTLPNDVDYIRTQPNNYGINLLNRRVQQSVAPANTIGSVLGRLNHAVDLFGNLLKKGALPGGAASTGGGQPGVSQQAVYNTSNATYVPTKIEIQLSLLPIQTRNQVSQQFSLKDYANGSLLRGGFW